MIRRPLLFMAAVYAAAIFICYYACTLSALAVGAAGALLLAGKKKPAATDGPVIKGPVIKGPVIMGLVMRGSATKKHTANGITSGSDVRSCRLAWLLLICYLLSILNFWMTENREYVLVEHEGETVILTGKINERQNRLTSSGDPFVQLEVAVNRITRNDSTSENPKERMIKHPERALIKVYDNPDFDGMPGQHIRIEGKLTIPDARRNPGCFDYRLYLKSLNIRTTMTAQTICLAAPNNRHQSAADGNLQTILYKVKVEFIESLRKAAGSETASMMNAILFGDKGELDEETLETFQHNGTAHVLAVSGLHIGIIYAFLLHLWNLIGMLTRGRLCARRGWGFFIIIGLFFWCYMVMASFSPSVVRAVIMILLHMIAQITNRRYDLHCAAFAVLLAVLVHSPFMLFNVGFQMSFLAVLTMGMILPYVHHFYTGVLAASVAIQLGLGPFMAYTFNYLSIAAVLVNIPVIFLAGIMVPMGVCGMLFSALGASCFSQFGSFGDLLCNSTGDFLFKSLGDFLFKSLGGLCQMLTDLNSWVGLEGVTTFTVTSPSLFLLGFYYLGLLLLASEEGRMALFRAMRKKQARAAVNHVLRILVVTVVLAMAFAWMAGDGFKKADLVFVDVGQGDCLHLRIKSTSPFGTQNELPFGIHLPGGREYNVLIDGGGSAEYDVGKKILRPYLLKNGTRKIDLAIVTHLHTDHYDGIRSLCRMGMVDKLFVYEGYKVNEAEILEECGLDASDIIYVTAGDIITEAGPNGAQFQFLAPPARSDEEYVRLASNEEDENNKSLLIKVRYRGVSTLMTGDISAEGEAAVMKEDTGNNSLHCDILKVGHHGSKYSTSESFLATVAPRIAVIQVGAHNMYGHPTPEVLQRLASNNVPVWRNDLQGAVGITTCKGRIKEVKAMIHPKSNQMDN